MRTPPDGKGKAKSKDQKSQDLRLLVFDFCVLRFDFCLLIFDFSFVLRVPCNLYSSLLYSSERSIPKQVKGTGRAKAKQKVKKQKAKIKNPRTCNPWFLFLTFVF
jgi:hypothetical protein